MAFYYVHYQGKRGSWFCKIACILYGVADTKNAWEEMDNHAVCPNHTHGNECAVKENTVE